MAPLNVLCWAIVLERLIRDLSSPQLALTKETPPPLTPQKKIKRAPTRRKKRRFSFASLRCSGWMVGEKRLDEKILKRKARAGHGHAQDCFVRFLQE